MTLSAFYSATLHADPLQFMINLHQRRVHLSAYRIKYIKHGSSQIGSHISAILDLIAILWFHIQCIKRESLFFFDNFLLFTPERSLDHIPVQRRDQPNSLFSQVLLDDRPFIGVRYRMQY